jgi:signal transduction histidine kinase
MIEINNEPCSITIVNDITERKRAEEALQLQSERLKLLNEIDRAILAAASPNAIAEVVLKKIRRLIPSRRASIILFDYERQEILAFAVNFDGHTHMPTGKVGPLDPEILALFPSDKVEVIPDIRELANPPQAIAQLRSEGIVSILGSPLLMHGELRGRLNLSSDRPHAFTSEHQEIAGQVAMQLAIALQQSQLYEQTHLHAIELEQRVSERTAQLEAANKELEAFAYSISHDLRAPLRAIDGFTRILEEDYEPFLDAEGQRVCAVIRRQTQRMGELIDNLLTFSRLSRVSMRISLIHMGALAQSVFYELTTPEDRERIDFLVEPLPVAMGDPTLIRQVWTNLLTNALKFSAKRERAIIKVSSRQEGGEIIYSVCDNGAGFDMQYADKLFGVFQRLHSEKEFAGTGVGLAIIQRVIHRHGGRVWAEGELDRGAAFYFTLPQQEE